MKRNRTRARYARLPNRPESGVWHLSPRAYPYDWWRIGLLATLVAALVVLAFVRIP